ncbi:MAG: class I SAM-dependent methyltransferase [Planctomycetaceae bacterium]|nr:class I SAM-dependent methyltransferase [Planctomycetaceae bacterium]
MTTPTSQQPVKGNWYDYPQYFDWAFADETPAEAAFIEAACRKFARGDVRRLLEPACGGGRLVVEMARRGYHVLGFDNNPNMVKYVAGRIAKGRLSAEVFAADMVDYRLPQPVDCAFNTFNTFRHLTTDEAALGHLRSTARAIRRGGLFILGMHLLPPDASLECIERWRAKRGATDVHYTLRVVNSSRRTRLERCRITMRVRKPGRELRLVDEFDLRLYNATQWRAILAQVPEFELVEVFDFDYDLDRPAKFDNRLSDAVFVLRRR